MHGCGEAQFRLALDCVEDALKDSDSPGIIEAKYWLSLAESNGVVEAASKLSQVRGSAYHWQVARMAHFTPVIYDCMNHEQFIEEKRSSDG